jgi:hypothetical protein
LAQRSRKRGQRAKPAGRPARATAGQTAGTVKRRSSEERNAAVRATLTPVEPGERPWPTLVSALIALALVITNLVLVILNVSFRAGPQRVSTGQEILYLIVMSMCAYGLWRNRYWAVLGFMVLLLLTVLTATLALVRVTNIGGAAFAIALIAGGGFLFYKLVRVLSRIQMPRPPGR